MRLRRYLPIVVVAGALALSACAATPAAEGEEAQQSAFASQLADPSILVAADSGSVKPLKYTEEGSTEFKGLIVELTQEYTKRMGVDVKIEKVSSDAVQPGVLANRYDVALAVGDFATRRETLDIVDLVNSGVVFLVQEGNPSGFDGTRDDLCGRSLAFGKGNVHQTYAEEQNEKCLAEGRPAIDMQGFPDGPTGTLALQSGRVDIQWQETSAANQLVKDSPDLFEIAGEAEMLAPYGVGVPKGKPELRDAIFEALTSMYEDGTYQALLEKWGQESIGLEKIEINGSKF